MPGLLEIATGVIGTLLVGSGLHGFFNPSSMGRTFGIVEIDSAAPAVFFPGIGGRNFAAGLFVWVMTLTGQRRALGGFLACWMTAGVADTWLLLAHDGPVDNVGIHAFNTCVLVVVSQLLLRSA